MNSKITGKLKENYLFLLILLLAIALRAYRLDTLTTFGRDPGIDFIAVREMILQHHISLIGIKVSIGEFFQGPLYRLSLIPMFWILRFNPIAGAITAIIFSTFSLIVLYQITKFLFKTKEVPWSTLVYSIFPSLISFGNTPFYQHFAVLPLLLSIWAFLYRNYLLAGLLAGVATEFHFLSVILVLTLLIYISYFIRSLKSVGFYILGLMIGFSPTLYFEFKHQFLNTNLFLSYLGSQSQGLNESLIKRATFITDHLLIIGLVFVGSFLFYIITKGVTKNILIIKRLVIICFAITTIFVFGITSFELHYPLVLYLLILILLPPLIFIKGNSWVKISFYVLLIANFIFLIPYLSLNHGYSMPEGWSLKKINQTADFINDDSKIHDNFNVASLLDGDTRTYPLRYTLLIRNLKFGDVNEYEQNNHLYLLAHNDDQKVLNSSLYEITSFNPYQIGIKKDLGDGIYLYRLDKQLSK